MESDTTSIIKESPIPMKEPPPSVKGSPVPLKDTSSLLKQSTVFPKSQSQQMNGPSVQATDTSAQKKDKTKVKKDPPENNNDPAEQTEDPPEQMNDPSEQGDDQPDSRNGSPEQTQDLTEHSIDPSEQIKDISPHASPLPTEDTIVTKELNKDQKEPPVPTKSTNVSIEKPPKKPKETNVRKKAAASTKSPRDQTKDQPKPTTEPPVTDDQPDSAPIDEPEEEPESEITKQEHCLKACTLVLDGVGYIARQLLLQEALTKYTSDHVFLKANKNKIKRLRIRGIIRESQYYILYPRNGDRSDIQDWDISLLTLVISNCLTLNKEQKGAVKKIQELRKSIHGKTVNLSLPEEEFHAAWEEITLTLREVVKLLVRDECSKELEEMIENTGKDTLPGNKMIEIMRDWYWHLTEEELTRMRERLNTSEDLRNSQMGISLTLLDEIATNLRTDPLRSRDIEEAKARLERHRRELEELNATPDNRHTHMVLQKLLLNHVAVLTGVRGSGKTHLALNTLKLMLDSNENLQPLIMCDPDVDDVRDAIAETTTDIVIFIDDFLGRFYIESEQLDNWNRYIQTLVSFIETGKIFVVVAVGKITKNKCVHEEVNTLFREDWVVDLDEAVMDETEKRNMIGLYASYYEMQIQTSDIDKVASMANINYGIASPQLCKVMDGRDIVSLFTRPVEVVKDDIANIKDKDITSFVALLMTLLCNDELQKNNFSETHSESFARVQSHFDGHLINQAEMFKAANALVNTYLKEDVLLQCYSFIHTVVLEATFEVALETIPDILLEFCPLVVLARLYSGVQNAFHFEKIIQRFSAAIFTSDTATALKCIAEWLMQQKYEFIDTTFKQMDAMDIYKEDKDGKSMLVYFASLGYVELVEKLETCLNQGMLSIKMKDEQILKATLAAIETSSIKSLQYLIPMQISVNDEMMFAAVKAGESEVLELLLANRGNIRALRKCSGENLIHEACRNNNINLARHILDSCDIAVKVELLTTKTTKDARTPLMYAAMHCSIETFKFILRYNRSIEIESEATTADGVTLLHMAAEGGQLDVLQYLCFHYRQIIHMTNTRKWNAAHSAAEKGQLECLICLLQRGLDAHARTEDSKTILHVATENGRLNVVKHICRHLKDLLAMRLDNDWTAAHVAAHTGNLDCFKHLTDNRVGLSTPKRCTVLHVASKSGQLEIVEYLCEKVPKIVQIVDNEQWNAAHYAAQGGQVKCLEHLLEQGLDPKAKTTGGETIIDIAFKGKKTEVVVYMTKKYQSQGIVAPPSSSMCSIL